MRFEDLEVWQRSAQLSVEIYRHFSTSRDFGFKDQITRSSLSISSNIAEGYERKSNKECINFLSYARGSSGELRSQIYIGIEIEYIEREQGLQWKAEAEQISKMISALISARERF